MALKTKVKVGNITNLSEARYCAGMGVDLLGFPVSGPDGISLEKFKEINGWITGPELVIEIDSSDNADELIEQFFAHHIEVDASLLSSLPNLKDRSLIVRVDLSNWKNTAAQLLPYKESIQYLIVRNVLDASIKILKEAAQNYSLLLEFDGKADLEDLLDLPMTGLALKGGNELKPGLKEYDQIASVLEKLEAEEAD